ncbi:MAG: SpaA isopeptide-forming pilin-related protein [Candidatus Humimicrobiaceae bacterium]
MNFLLSNLKLRGKNLEFEHNEDGLVEIKRFKSNNDGTFKVYLKPGKYILEPLKSNEPYPIGSPMEVEVKPNQFSEVNISYDTGIR